MIVYHGSTLEVAYPDALHSARNLDFGRGFYVTTVKEQAIRWARRKQALEDANAAVLNRYDMREPLPDMRVRDFGDSLEDWIDFVCACRDGEDVYKAYDIVKGKVANDKVYRVVDFYKAGIWDRARAVKEVREYKTYDQIAFITQDAIERLLAFEGSEEV